MTAGRNGTENAGDLIKFPFVPVKQDPKRATFLQGQMLGNLPLLSRDLMLRGLT